MDVILRTGESSRRKWTPGYVEASAKEAKKFLNGVQYDHAVQLVLTLCEEDDPTHPVLLDVGPVKDFYELRDKGGVLLKINLRIYFCVFHDPKSVIVLGPWNKKKEGQIPPWIMNRMKGRHKIVKSLIRTGGDDEKTIVAEALIERMTNGGDQKKSR